jgi:hypothetical protein
MTKPPEISHSPSGGHPSLLHLPEELLANILDYVLPHEFTRPPRNSPPAAVLRLIQKLPDAPNVAQPALPSVPSICLPLRALHSKLNAAVLLSVLRWIDCDGEYLFTRFDEAKLKNRSEWEVNAFYCWLLCVFQFGNSLYERLYLLALRQASPEEQANKGLPGGFGGPRGSRDERGRDGCGIKTIPPYALEGLRLRKLFPANFFRENAFLVKVDLSSPFEVEYIDDGFFAECTTLKSIDLKGLGKVRAICGFFLAGCVALEEVDLSPLVSLTVFGHSALSACHRLRFVSMEGLGRLESIGDQFLCAETIPRESKVVLQILGIETLGRLVSIGNEFLSTRRCIVMTSVLDESLEEPTHQPRSTVGSPRSELTLRCPLLKTIGRDFGLKLRGIRKVDLSACQEQKTIPDSFLTNSSDVEVVVLPPNTTTIGNGVLTYSRVQFLPNFHQLTSLTAIGDSFAVAAHLVSIKTPPSLRIIGAGFVVLNSKLTTVEILIPAVERTPLDRDEKGDGQADSGGVKAIMTFGNGCFAKCPRLAKLEVVCHNSETEAQIIDRMKGLVEIGDNFGRWCGALARVDLGLCPIAKVGCGFLESCVTLVDVRLPSTLKRIGADFLSGCSALERVALTRRIQTELQLSNENNKLINLMTEPDHQAAIDNSREA